MTVREEGNCPAAICLFLPTMHNLKSGAILGALCGLAGARAQCEPSESENKTNDGNGCNYIHGRVLTWLAESLHSPSLSSQPFSFLSHFKRQPPDLLAHSTPVVLSRGLFYHLCLCRQVRRRGVYSLSMYSRSHTASAVTKTWGVRRTNEMEVRCRQPILCQSLKKQPPETKTHSECLYFKENLWRKRDLLSFKVTLDRICGELLYEAIEKGCRH